MGGMAATRISADSTNTTQQAMDEKARDSFVEMSTAKPSAVEAGDYSGAIAKTDPKEIALVKKLDRRIMPTLWCMYFLNYVSSIERDV
jgi:hypothetical protein